MRSIPELEKLQPFGHMWHSMENRLQIASDDDLKALHDATKLAGSSVCWYALTEAAKILQPMIIAEQTRRAHRVIQLAMKPAQIAAALGLRTVQSGR